MVQKSQDGRMMVWVNEDGQSEGLAVMAGIDVQSLRHSKEGRLPSGALSRENCD